MKQFVWFVWLSIIGLLSSPNLPIFAQLGMTAESIFTYPSEMSDIWGYEVAGKEYAIATTEDLVSIVDVSDGFNPVEVFSIGGPNTFWRDPKVFGSYAYITNEAGGGMQIIDLSALPSGTINSSSDVYYYNGGNYNGNNINFTTAHNVFIDENGIAYVVGSNYSTGGAIMLDLNIDPINPPIIGIYNTRYIHDCFVRGDIMYAAEINDGLLTIVDVSVKSNPQILGATATSSGDSHNVWVSDDGQFAFTTDETNNANIDAYDVSNPNDIKRVGIFQSSVSSGAAPHNAFVLGNLLYISYYRDGVVVADITHPELMLQVGYYDTAPSYSGGGFNGCWGVYPYFSSGKILATDIEEGLYVLNEDIIPAAFLEGIVTDNNSGNPIPGAAITISGINGADVNANFTGDYLTGVLAGGTYDVTFAASGYVSQTISLNLTNGVTLGQNIQLEISAPFQLVGTVYESGTTTPIPNADVYATDGLTDYFGVANGSGDYSITVAGAGNYSVYSGKWGFVTNGMSNLSLTTSNNTVDIELEAGYYDDFLFDNNWASTINGAGSGIWELAVPYGTFYGGFPSNPDIDISTDFGNQCYVTGNQNSNGAGDDDVDGGDVILESPIFDLSTYGDAELRYYRWFRNAGGSSTPDDQMEIFLSNGVNSVSIELIEDGDAFEAEWKQSVITVSDFLTPTSTMQFTVIIGDLGDGHLVEGGIDLFEVEDLNPNVNPIPPPTFAGKVILEGCYDQTSGMMTTELNNAGLLPFNQPYNSAPWNYGGLESSLTFSSDIVDWLLIEARSAVDTSLLEQQACVLLSNGDLMAVDGSPEITFTSIPGNANYFVSLRHRNHLAILTNSAVTLPTASPYDFTIPSNVEEGSSQLSSVGSSTFAMRAGDYDANGVITIADFNLYQIESSAINDYTDSDGTLDSHVTVADYNIYVPNSSVIGINILRY